MRRIHGRWLRAALAILLPLAVQSAGCDKSTERPSNPADTESDLRAWEDGVGTDLRIPEIGTAPDSSSPDTGPDSFSPDTGSDSFSPDTGSDSSSPDSDQDDANDGPMIEACADGMSAVTEGEDVLYCVDTYEVVVEGDLGDRDQYAPGAIPPTAIAHSTAGVIPTTGVSFGQALAICANTPVMGSDGEQHGFKHLVTREEWQDAADGVPGPGGSLYPYGNQVDPDICATTGQFGNPVYEALQPTGSLPGCVSSFGVYDQCGNAWEWADAGLTTDADGWFDLVGATGLLAGVDEDGYLIVTSDWNPSLAELVIVGDVPPLLSVDENDRLVVWLDPMGGQVMVTTGFLVFGGGYPGTTTGDEFLTVVLGLKDGEPFPYECPLIPILSPPAVPIPAKLGGTYYTGSPTSCATTYHGLRHTHDFEGTIGFRCACPPILVPE